MPSYQAHTDQELVVLLRAGDHMAFSEIFSRYNKLLYSHAYNKLRKEDEAQDIVQDIFVKLWERHGEVQDINLSGYLFTMVRNKILNLLSHNKIVSNYSEYLQKYLPGETGATDHLIREKQLAEIIEAEIAALPPRMREIFELSRNQHLSNKEIAQQLQLSEHTVADQIKKSLRALRLRIGLIAFLAFLLHH